jgi:HSP20 family protein
MYTLEKLRRGLGQTWESLAEGWNHLRERAGQAITRFKPISKGGELDTLEDQIVRSSADWALLASDVCEDETDVTVRLEVPGMSREDFDIDVLEDYLVVRGEKHVQREQQQGRYHVMQCAYGSFERLIPLPVDVDKDGARARYNRGVLIITLPKHKRLKNRRIEVDLA